MWTAGCRAAPAALLLPLAPTGLCAQTVTAPRDAAIVAFVDSTLALARRRDTASLRALTDSSFVFVHSTGRVDDLAAFLAFAVQGRQTARAS